MAKRRLSESVVNRLAPTARDYIVWDTELPRFGIRVKPTGIKSYLVQYRNQRTGASRRKNIGQHGSQLSFSQAKETARNILTEPRSFKGGSSTFPAPLQSVLTGWLFAIDEIWHFAKIVDADFDQAHCVEMRRALQSCYEQALSEAYEHIDWRARQVYYRKISTSAKGLAKAIGWPVDPKQLGAVVPPDSNGMRWLEKTLLGAIDVYLKMGADDETAIALLAQEDAAQYENESLTQWAERKKAHLQSILSSLPHSLAVLISSAELAQTELSISAQNYSNSERTFLDRLLFRITHVHSWFFARRPKVWDNANLPNGSGLNWIREIMYIASRRIDMCADNSTSWASPLVKRANDLSPETIADRVDRLLKADNPLLHKGIRYPGPTEKYFLKKKKPWWSL